MITKRHFRWLPNALTLSRMGLGAVVCYCAARGFWALASLLFFIAVSTDFFDGLAAKKLDAQTKIGAQLDRLADFAVSGLGLIGLAVAGLISWWVVLVTPIVAIFLAEERVFVPKTGWLHRRRPVLSIAYLFSVWVFISWMLLTQAFGWQRWYIPATVVLLLGSASLKRHRLRAWLGLASKPGAPRAK